MTERNYICNFCRDKIQRVEGTKNTFAGLGLVWESDEKHLEIKHCQDAENHLCNTCFQAITALK